MLKTFNWKDVEQMQKQVLVHDCEFGWKDDDHEKMKGVVDKFAADMATKDQSAEYYEKKRNAKMPIWDIKTGKFGEFVTALFLWRHGWPLVIPDCTIRTGISKGWDCDLPFQQKNNKLPNVHVKTCDQKTKNFAGEYTWTFQYGNNYGTGGRDKLFDRPNSTEIITFVYFDSVDAKKAIIVATAPWNLVHSILRDPIAKKLIGLKKCVYYSDLVFGRCF